MRSWKSLVLNLAVCAVGTSVARAATIVTFDNDTIGFKPNNWHSVDSSVVSFSDSIGADLSVWKFAENNMNPALVISPDDGSRLLMDFSAPATTLALDFGNDDPSAVTTAYYGILKAYDGNTLVAENDMHVNANDLVDQTISVSSTSPITHAEFFFADSNKNPAMLTEIVDNVTFNSVPEPTTLGLLLPGAVMLLRRRK